MTTSRRIFNLPFPRNRFFTGRGDILEGLRKSFNAGENVQVLNGLGGIGKTQTALEYAYRYQQDYQVVLWASGISHEMLVADFAKIAGLLNLPEKNAQDRNETADAVRRWLEHNSAWLLILDNADEIVQVQEFIPSNEAGHILLTSRAHAMGEIGEGNALEKMTPQEGALFLLRRLRKIKKDETYESADTELRAQAEALSTMVDGLPLALDQAAAFIEEKPSTLKEYQVLFQSGRNELLKRQSKLAPKHPSVVVTFSLAFDKVAEANPAAADLLRACAFLEADSIPEEIFSEGAEELGEALSSIAESPLSLSDAIEEAGRFSLLRRQPEAHTLSLHRLVQAVLIDEMEEAEKRLWAERAVRTVNKIFPRVEYSNWPACSRLISQAQILASVIDEYGFEFLESALLLNRSASYLHKRAQYEESEPLYVHSLAILEKTLGPEHQDVAVGLNNLASLYFDQGRSAEAEPLYVRALELREKELGSEHPEVATSLNNLGALYCAQSRNGEAELLYTRALAIRERLLDPKHLDIATSLNNLASLYSDQNKYAEAERLYVRALDIEEKVLGSAHPVVANSLNNLAALYATQEKYEKAKSLYNRALKTSEKALGPEHPEVANRLNNLASLYSDQNKYKEAEPLFLRALNIRETVLDSMHPLVATSLNNLANLYNNQNKYAESEPLYVRALNIREKALGPKHPSTAQVLNNLAYLYSKQKRYAEAEPLFVRAKAIYEAAYGREHPEVARVLENYVPLLRAIGKDIQAEELEARASAIRKRKLQNKIKSDSRAARTRKRAKPRRRK